ncbi:MAG TPA: LacI family DNA-binding transcriptional regulator [Cellulomonas sp.]
MSGRVTARHVAQRAGVSQSTVSYVLNDSPNQTITPATRQRVLDAVEELHYVPSAAARALRSGTSRVALIVLPDAPIGSTISQLIERVSDDLEPFGYSVVYRRHRGSAMLERAWRETRPAAVVDLAAVGEEDRRRIRAAGIPVIEAALDDLSRVGALSVGQVEIGRLQAHHLLELGHRHLGYAAPDDRRVDGYYTRRLLGVREACAAAGVPEPVVVPVPLDAGSGAAAVSRWTMAPRGEQVTGVCAYNDEVAFALLAGARILGRVIPDDLAVVGVDNVPLSPLAAPALTTVDIGTMQIADELSRLMRAAMLGEDASVGLVEPAATLVRRAST